MKCFEIEKKTIEQFKKEKDRRTKIMISMGMRTKMIVIMRMVFSIIIITLMMEWSIFNDDDNR